VKELNKFHIYETEKITRKASSPRLSCTMTHISVDVQRITLNALCMTISGERTEQLDIFCCVTGFTSDFHPPQTCADICVGHDDLGWM